MKSTLLKTLAATSLVATTHADIHVLGASFKERGVNAPLGTIITNPGTVSATRGYLIFDDTVLTAAPNKATYIEYGDIRDAGVITRYYTIDSDFTAFKADSILGDSGGRRLYGHMHAPVLVADVTNPLIPFSGTQFSTGFPRKLSFDQTAFQTGASDSVPGPRIVMADSSTLRSVVSGSANPVNVGATTISGATTELLTRLEKQGYGRTLAEAPTFTTDLNATLQLTDGQQSALTVVVGSDALPDDGQFPAPTFQWFKDNVAIPAAVGSSYTVTGGTSTATNGFGSYKVVATNSIGSTTSTTTVVTARALAFATQPEPAVTIVGASTATLTATLTPVPGTPPTFQWQKAATSAGPFTPIAAAAGGNKQSLLVVGAEAATGAGVYRLDVTSSAGTIQSALSTVTINPAGTAFVFTTNAPKAVAVAFAGTFPLAPVVNATANPAVASLQWFKAPLNNPTAFVAIPAGDGGTVATLTVSGNNANVRGPGVYHLVATSTGATPVVITTVDTTVTTAP
jgi:hypothetical protein